MLCTYLVDDHGEKGEYASFIKAYHSLHSALDLKVFSNAFELMKQLKTKIPDLVLLDMRFDITPTELLYGDLEKLAQNEPFSGNLQRAEKQLRAMQGLFILNAVRTLKYQFPIVLFATLNPTLKKQILNSSQPLQILDGLLIKDFNNAIIWATNFIQS